MTSETSSRAPADLFRFDNGLQFAHRATAEGQAVAIVVCLYNGSRFEQPHQAGYAHFLEHLLFKDTRRFSQIEMAEEFEAMGGLVNAHTGRELTTFEALVPRDCAAEACDRLLSMLTEATFNQHDVALEREVVFQEMAGVRDVPADWADEEAVRQAWADHPAGRPILGEMDTLRAADAATLHGYLSTQLTGERLSVAVTGPTAGQDPQAWLAPLAVLPAGQKPVSPPPAFYSGHHDVGRPVEQSQLLWLMPAPAVHGLGRAAVLAANQLLGGGTASRLFQRLRERDGLAYEVDARVESYSDAGLWVVYTACESKLTEKAIAAVEQEVERLATKGPSERELTLVNRHLDARLRLAADDRLQDADQLTWRCAYGLPLDDGEGLRRELAALTERDVRDALARAWETRLNWRWVTG